MVEIMEALSSLIRSFVKAIIGTSDNGHILSDVLEINKDWCQESEEIEAIRKRIEALTRLLAEDSDELSSLKLQRLRRILRNKILHSANQLTKKEIQLWMDLHHKTKEDEIFISFSECLTYSFKYDPLHYEISLAIREINKALRRRRLLKKKTVQYFLFSSFVKSRVLLFSFVRPKGNKYSPKSIMLLLNELLWNLKQGGKPDEEKRFSKIVTARRLCIS